MTTSRAGRGPNGVIAAACVRAWLAPPFSLFAAGDEQGSTRDPFTGSFAHPAGAQAIWEGEPSQDLVGWGGWAW